MTLIATRPVVSQATVCMTSDTWRSAAEFVLDIAEDGIVIPGTFFLAVDLIDTVGPRGLSMTEIRQLMAIKQEMGVYTDLDMVLNYPQPSYDRLVALKTLTAAKGLDPVTVAPQGRVWSAELAEFARNVGFQNVRVASSFDFQSWPIADRLNIINGGYISFGATTTAVDFLARVDQLEAAGGGMLSPNMHEVGGASGIPIVEITAIYTELKARWDAGRIRCCTYRDAMTPLYI